MSHAEGAAQLLSVIPVGKAAKVAELGVGAVERSVVNATEEVAAKTGTKLISQFSTSTIDDAVKLVANDANKLNHRFPARHNLGSLVNKLGKIGV